MNKEYFTDNISTETLAKLIDETLRLEKNNKNRSIKSNLLKIIPAVAAIVLIIGLINVLPIINNGSLNGNGINPGAELFTPFYDQNIDGVESIIIKIPGKEDAVFTFEGTGPDLKVTGNGNVLDADIFKDFYYSILSINSLWSKTGTGKNEDKDLLMLDITLTAKDGIIKNNKFYSDKSSLKVCFVDDGGGMKIYFADDIILKLINDTELILQNLPIRKDAPK